MKKQLQHILLLGTCLFGIGSGSVHGFPSQPMEVEAPLLDTVVQVDAIQVTAIKQGLTLRGRPVAASILGRNEADERRILSLRGISEVVPNLHIPQYGSRITSSIYVRGLGARIDQPAVGLNIDNVPILNKDAYDLDLMDIERIEVLRGPQSTLFGRNTMGGVINLYTLSPMSYQGVRLGIEASSGNTWKFRASAYERLGDHWGISAGAHYYRTDGRFTNEYTGQRCDWERSGGSRIKLQWNGGGAWRVENTLSFTDLTQGGYPYAFAGRSSDEPLPGGYEPQVGVIAYNDPSGYRRTNLNDGLTVRYAGERVTVMSITSYQYLDDRMQLDQDFLPLSYFTLTQARREHAATEEIVLRSKREGGYNFLFGGFLFYRHTRMEAPVLFKEDGLEALILGRFEGQGIGASWNEDTFLLESQFRQPNYGGALYHESYYETDRWRLTAGVRIDLEGAQLQYHSRATGSYTLQTPDGKLYPNTIAIDNSDRLRNAFVEVLPKLSALYRIDAEGRNSIYASVAKGYKAGGFNTQMFSDVLQQQVMKQMGFGTLYDVADVVTYDPEKSWNFEVGGHFATRDGMLRAEAALFWIECRDQQLTVFPEGQVTGRMMTNAGHTRSLGGELSAQFTPWRNLSIDASYGYTHATFLRFDNGRQNFAGKRIPYAPEHTLSARAAYTFEVKKKWLERITLSAATRGAGRIWWNEANTLSQPFYALLEASVRFEQKHYALTLWGDNLTNTPYDTFHFVSIGNAFLQKGGPRTFGITLSINL